MTSTITATDLARGLSDVLNRVRYRGERFIIDRNGEPTAVLAPVEPPMPITMREFITRLGQLPAPDPDFANQLEEVQAEQLPAGSTPWAS